MARVTNGVIIYYFGTYESIRDLKISLRLLRKHLLKSYDYPVFIFHPHSRLQQSEKDQVIRDCEVAASFHSIVPFEEQGPLESAGNHFRAIGIYDEPSLSEFEWYLLLKSTSLITSPFPDDPFDDADKSNSVYVSPNSPDEFQEYESGAEALLKTVLEFIDIHSVYIDDAKYKNITDLTVLRQVHCPGFEISRFSWWQSPLVKSFLEAVDQSGGMFRFGWSDSAVHTLALRLFANQAAIRMADVSFVSPEVILSIQKDPRVREDLIESVSEKLASPLIVCCVNTDYVQSGLVENWYRSISRVGLADHALIVALDFESVELLGAMGIDSVYWRSTRFTTIDAQALEFRKCGWKQVVFSKLEVVKRILSGGRDVIFSDADVVFLRNPIPLLQSIDRDFCIQSGETANLTEDHPSVCSGFYSARACSKNIEALDANEVEIEAYEGDQDLIRDRVIRGRLNAKILSLQEFPNGRFWRDNMTMQPYIVHFNWILGVEQKRKHMQECGLWLVPSH